MFIELGLSVAIDLYSPFESAFKETFLIFGNMSKSKYCMPSFQLIIFDIPISS